MMYDRPRSTIHHLDRISRVEYRRWCTRRDLRWYPHLHRSRRAARTSLLSARHFVAPRQFLFAHRLVSIVIVLLIAPDDRQASEFIANDFYMRCSRTRFVFVIASMGLGTFLMSLIGKWA